MNFLIPFLYSLIFCWLILKLEFFKQSGIKPVIRIALFYLKIITGVFVIYIYTHFYKNPATADILLYYHDGKIMSDALSHNPSDFFRMLSGIGCDTEYFNQKYFSVMDRWHRHHESFFFNDTHTIIRFNAFSNLFAFGAFQVNTVFMCFISFTGLVALFRAFVKYFHKKKTLLVLAIFLPPALLFWSSAILKEGILMFCVGFFVYSFLKLTTERTFSVQLLLMLVLSVALFLVNKVYILLLLFPPLLCFALLHRFNFRFKWLIYILIHVLIVTGGLIFSNKMLNKDFVEELIRHQRDFINVAKGGVFLERDSVFMRLDYADQNRILPSGKNDSVQIKPGSSYEYWINGNMEDTFRVNNSVDTTLYHLQLSIEPARSAYYMPHLKYKLSSFLEYAPKAFLNVLLRPYITEAENLYQKACSVENIIYIFLFVLCLFFGDYSKCNWNLFWLGIFFTVNLFLIIGFTTPVAGALVRYKAPALPFLLMSAFSLLNVEKARKIPLLNYLFKE